jgi:hypothetical protein
MSACRRKDDTVCHREFQLIGDLHSMDGYLSIKIDDRAKGHDSHGIQRALLSKFLQNPFGRFIQTIVGTSKLSESTIDGSKKLAFASSTTYSIQPYESTMFINAPRQPLPEFYLYSYL